MFHFLTRRQFLCSSALMVSGIFLCLTGRASAQAANLDGTQNSNTEVTQDYSATAYQKTVERHVAQDQRIIHLSITNQHTTNQTDRVCYKATWSDTDGPAWYARHNLPEKMFQEQMDSYAAQGFRPIELCAYTVGTTPFFGGLWQLTDGPDWTMFKGLSPTEFAAKDKSLTDQGYHLAQSCKYTGGGKPLVLGLWQK